VIERAVLEHQDDDVVDLLQVGHANLLNHHTAFAARLAIVVNDYPRSSAR
jgi:hypothetical protein